MSQSREASLQLSIDSLKSLTSSYVIRAKQAEELAGRLLTERLNPEQMAELKMFIGQQMDVRSTERAVHQQAVIQATCVALTQALTLEGNVQRDMLVDILKNLTTAAAHLPNVPRNSTAPSK
jgi:hypothetical protein